MKKTKQNKKKLTCALIWYSFETSNSNFWIEIEFQSILKFKRFNLQCENCIENIWTSNSIKCRIIESTFYFVVCVSFDAWRAIQCVYVTIVRFMWCILLFYFTVECDVKLFRLRKYIHESARKGKRIFFAKKIDID